MVVGILLGASLALGGAVLAGFLVPSPGPLLKGAASRDLAEIADRVQREYLQPVSDQQLMEHATRGMLTALDTHSQYLDARQYEKLRLSTRAGRTVSARQLPGGIGYLQIREFTDSTAREVRSALGKLPRTSTGAISGLGLVLDLRDNPGGVVEAAVEVADSFLERGLIVSVRGRTRETSFQHQASPGDLLAGAPLVVLVNGASASAAEIVAAALQDQRRATLVGTRTFGKGTVQTIIPLSAGRALKLTTGVYFTARGVAIDGQGVEPDVNFGAEHGQASVQRAARLLEKGPAFLVRSP